MSLFRARFLSVGFIILFMTLYLPVANATSTSITNVTGDYWVSKASLHQPRSVLGVAVVNNKIYAIGGSVASGYAPSQAGNAVYGDFNVDSYVGTNEVYDPASNTWSNKSSMPTHRIAFATAVFNDKIYCIGGVGGGGGQTAVVGLQEQMKYMTLRLIGGKQRRRCPLQEDG